MRTLKELRPQDDVQAALDIGGDIRLKPGTYMQSAPWIIKVSGTHLRGARGVVVKRGDDFPDGGIRIYNIPMKDGGPPLSDCSVEDIDLRTDGESAVWFVDMLRGTMRNIRVTGRKQMGAWGVLAIRGSILDSPAAHCLIEKCTLDGVFGCIYIDGGWGLGQSLIPGQLTARHLPHHCTVRGCTTRNGSGIGALGFDHLVENNLVVNGWLGCRDDGEQGNQARITFRHNIVKNRAGWGPWGIALDPGTDFIIENNQIEAGVGIQAFRYAHDYAGQVSFPSRVIIRNNTIKIRAVAQWQTNAIRGVLSQASILNNKFVGNKSVGLLLEGDGNIEQNSFENWQIGGKLKGDWTRVGNKFKNVAEKWEIT